MYYAPRSALLGRMVAPANRPPPFLLGNGITTGLRVSRASPRLLVGSRRVLDGFDGLQRMASCPQARAFCHIVSTQTCMILPLTVLESSCLLHGYCMYEQAKAGIAATDGPQVSQ